MCDVLKLNFSTSLYCPSRFSCPSCSFFSSSCRCFSACFLACLASSIFSMPILTPHPDLATTPDSATQAAIESMANLRFMLQTARDYFRDTRSSSSQSRTLCGRVVPLALELRVGGIDLLHPLLRILPDLRFQVGHLVGVVGLRKVPVCCADLLRPRPLRHPESPSRLGEPGLLLQCPRGTALLSPLPRRGAPGILICPAMFFTMADLILYRL